MTRGLFVVAVAIALSTTVRAADPPAKGTAPGQMLPGPFNSYIVGEKPKFTETLTEERQNDADATRALKFSCLVTRFGLDPTVAVFSHDAPADDQPVAKLLESLEKSVVKYRNSRLHAFGIFLTLDKDKDFLKDNSRLPKIKAVKELGTKLNLKEVPLAITQAENATTAAYELAPDDKVVVLLYDNFKVKARFKFNDAKPFDDAGLKEVEAAVKKLIGK